ncbi:MAG: hypothetical protein LBV78_26685 [Kitasatospora sp.]|nr:hypothetical protein [Kitasatospora sp.]
MAVLAAAAGAGIVLAVTGSSGGSPSAGNTRGGSALPGSGATTLFLAGTVTAVSATSITIAGAGPTVTATVTPSTRVSGRVTSIRGIKVGDQVSALITRNGSGATAAAIAYPPQPPGGAGAP